MPSKRFSLAILSLLGFDDADNTHVAQNEEAGIGVIVEFIPAPFRRFNDRPALTLFCVKLVGKRSYIGHIKSVLHERDQDKNSLLNTSEAILILMKAFPAADFFRR